MGGHLELTWENERFRAFVEALASRHTVIRYDPLGTGLSETRRSEEDFSLRFKLEALERLLDHLGLERCSPFGFSSGGPLAVAYAGEHPDRVSRLVLYGTDWASSPTRSWIRRPRSTPVAVPVAPPPRLCSGPSDLRPDRDLGLDARFGGDEDRALARRVRLLAVLDDIHPQRLLGLGCPQRHHRADHPQQDIGGDEGIHGAASAASAWSPSWAVLP